MNILLDFYTGQQQDKVIVLSYHNCSSSAMTCTNGPAYFLRVYTLTILFEPPAAAFSASWGQAFMKFSVHKICKIMPPSRRRPYCEIRFQVISVTADPTPMYSLNRQFLVKSDLMELPLRFCISFPSLKKSVTLGSTDFLCFNGGIIRASWRYKSRPMKWTGFVLQLGLAT